MHCLAPCLRHGAGTPRGAEQATCDGRDRIGIRAQTYGVFDAEPDGLLAGAIRNRVDGVPRALEGAHSEAVLVCIEVAGLRIIDGPSPVVPGFWP